MYGRYGTDQLYKFNLVLALVLILAELIVSYLLPDTLLFSYIALVLSILIVVMYGRMIFRSMSRNIYKRRKENERFLKNSRALKRFFSFNTSKGTKSRNLDDFSYIFRDCTKCGATLRLPRKKGRHKVRCPKCSHCFFVKSK